LAEALRLSGVAWDGGIGAHPDERHLVGLAEGLGWPDRLNPFALDPAFPYGHLPLYLLALVGGRDQLMPARLLVALLNTGTVALAAALGQRMGGRRAGLLAAAFLAVMPLHVQQAHFGTADVPLAFFVTGTLLFATRLAERGRWRDAVLAGLWAGLALGCKAGAALLALPLVAACGVGPATVRGRVGRGLAVAGMALAAFALTNPFALLEFSRFAANVAAQAALARGTALAPYTLQYHGTLPYLYPVAQQLTWGMGLVLGLVCFGGAGIAIWQAVRRPLAPAEWVGLAWTLPFFIFIGGLFVKFPRYLLPLTPLLAVYGAQAVVKARQGHTTKGTILRGVLVALALLPASLLSLALVASYDEPHPWAAASDWIAVHLPPGAVVAVEAWDHPLPLDPAGRDVQILPVFDEESPEKWEAMEHALAEADAVVVASRRGYGALARWPGRFPLTTAYYQALFAGEGGFRIAACFGRWPRVGPLALADDPFGAVGLPPPEPVCRPAEPVLWLPRLDESFVVYDHPSVVILRRDGQG
jgi:4-amino-4-deoxy-L-arabinose transferase-like glycosyltransferase